MTRSIRFRITVTAGVALALVMSIAGVALVLLQRSSLTASIDRALAQRAADVEALLETKDGFVELPTSREEGFVVVMSGDSVVAATPNLADGTPLSLEAPHDGDRYTTVSGLAVDDDVFRVLSRPLQDGLVLHVGTTYDVVAEATVALLAAMSVLIPLVTVLLVALTWWLVGRTLGPVEAIRAEVGAINAGDLALRVPEPGTGDEIDRLAVTMNEMLARIEDSLERERRFVSDASHELRSPITRLRGELELLMRSRGTDPVLDSLHDEVILMQATVEDLLFLARADAGELPIPLQPVDLDDLVIEEASHPGNVRFDVMGVSAALVRGNRSMLRRAVANLIDNARRHASAEVAVTLREEDQWAVLTVVDDGPGVPAAHAESIFDRFRRADEARSLDDGGTGLGLAIARQIAEAHHGSLRVVNPGDPGARFELRIPRSG